VTVTHYESCANTRPHLKHEFKVVHSALKDTATFTCPGVSGKWDQDATPLERVLAELEEYRNSRVSLRIFVDGVVRSGGTHPDGSRPTIYAQVKTSDLRSFLKTECSQVHGS
jgi:hypothetical protein